ncbi:MAG: formylmethanofuran dehydrogenase subunit E family protein [Deltaproteobacteria bacterium]|nr:formylmethanofuran dehydrogenase subunit E family protein [Deltaproteobacteria bacterium]
MSIGPYSVDEFVERVVDFHGYAAPGVIIGGYMVALAQRNLTQGVLYDAVSETRACLPDAIQLLTPCTVGNGWLKVLNLGRYALSLYDKRSGEGVRVHLDGKRLDAWPAIKVWFLCLNKKQDQDSALLQEQIREAGEGLCVVAPIRIAARFLGKQHKEKVDFCPMCGEAYPTCDGRICKGCQGQAPYEPLPSTLGAINNYLKM